MYSGHDMYTCKASYWHAEDIFRGGEEEYATKRMRQPKMMVAEH